MYQLKNETDGLKLMPQSSFCSYKIDYIGHQAKEGTWTAFDLKRIT